jgi:hypothetical protein
MKTSRELKMALFDANKEKFSVSEDGYVGFIQMPQSTINLNMENAKLVMNSARKLGISPDEFINNLIQVDLGIAKKFSNLSQEIQDLIK